MLDDQNSLNALVTALTPAQRDLVTAQTKTEFDDAFSALVLDAVRRLEKDSKNFVGLCEDGLSSLLCGFISGSNALIVTREESSNGHVDLTFKAQLCKPQREVLGEAKIFNYYNWHESGLSQLVERYSTGREDRGLLLVYVKKDGIKDRMEKLRDELDEKRPCGQTQASSKHNQIKWSFFTAHKHSSGEEIEIWHLGCNLHTPKKTAAPKKKAKK